MNDKLLNIILLLGFLVLVARVLMFSRASLVRLIGGLLTWVAIGAVFFVGFQHRDQIDAFFARITGSGAQIAEGETVRIRMSADGHFWARARLNGVERRMLIDSGATITALSSDTAAAVGAEERMAPPVLIETANGTVTAKSAEIDRVEIGPLSTEDLHVVVAPSFGELDVLGMNFLSRLKSWRVEGKTLVLEPGPRDTQDASR